MANVQTLHQELQAFCVDNSPEINPQLGFAIHKRFILDLYKKSLQNLMNLDLRNKFIQSQAIIGDFFLSFGLDIDYQSTSINLFFNAATGRNEVDLKGLKLTLKISATSNNTGVLGLISTTSITYDELKANFALDNHDLKLIPTAYKLFQNTVTVEDPNKPQILTQMQINANTYDIKEQAIIMIAVEELSKGFTEAVIFPDFYSMLVGFKFNEGGKLGSDSTNNFFFFSASGVLNIQQCAFKGSKNEIAVTASASATTTSANNTNNVSATVTSDDSVWNQYVKPIERTTEIDRHDLFVYIPSVSYKIPFESVVKPAVNFRDRGSIGPIYWRWSASAALKSLGISINSVNGDPSIILSAPNYVEGQAGAGVKIGCIRYEAAGAMCDGEVDPLDIEFTISIDLKVPAIIFVSRIKNAVGKNFSFRTFPKMDFPLSEILDFLLARIAETLITSQTGKFLNTTRITLADFSIFRDISGVANNLAYHQDNDGNLTAGVLFKK